MIKLLIDVQPRKCVTEYKKTRIRDFGFSLRNIDVTRKNTLRPVLVRVTLIGLNA